MIWLHSCSKNVMFPDCMQIDLVVSCATAPIQSVSVYVMGALKTEPMERTDSLGPI